MKYQRDTEVNYKELFEKYLVLHYKVLFLVKFSIGLIVSLLTTIVFISIKTHHYFLGGFHIAASIVVVLLYLSTKRRYTSYKEQHISRIEDTSHDG
jgi:uncharacterized membrane protein